jgi:DNA-binding transcriptional LysR family regulator
MEWTMDINGCLAFVAVIEHGSFAAAARELGLPRSTVSARVAALETRLGKRLLRRTTRQVAPTAEGEAWYATVAEAIRTLREADRRGLAGHAALSGTIRLSVPLDFPDTLLSRAITAFLAQHPLVQIDVHVGNEVVDFAGGNFDLAVRSGRPGGEEAVARRITGFRFGTFASPDWLAVHPPRTERLAFAASFSERARGGGTLAGDVRVRATSFALLRQLAIDGAGVAVLPLHLCAEAVAAGQLVQIDATDGAALEPDLFIVYPSRRDMSARARAFAQHLAATIEAGNGTAGQPVANAWQQRAASLVKRIESKKRMD